MLNLKPYSISLLLVIIFSFYSSGKAYRPDENVKYFIDADCSKCSVTGHTDAKLWIVTEKTYSGKLSDQKALIQKFKEKIQKLLNADAALTQRIVLRYQDTEKELLESYEAKENKMKARGYNIVKVDFDPEQ